MAPKRGGGGGGGSSGSSSSGSTCDDCTFTLTTLYGHRYTSLYSKSELYGQLVLHVIWALALLLVLARTRRLGKALAVQAAAFLLFCASALWAAQFGLLVAETDVPNAFRYVAAVTTMLQRLALPLLLLAAFAQLRAGRLAKLLFYPALAVYAALNAAYLAYDFVLAADALAAFEDEPNDLWRLWDRDFGTTLTPRMVEQLKLTASGDSDLAPGYVFSRMAGGNAKREVQVKVGVAADFLALALALFIGAWVGISLLRKRNTLKQSVGLGFFLSIRALPAQKKWLG
jgi:hypothetical protein